MTFFIIIIKYIHVYLFIYLQLTAYSLTCVQLTVYMTCYMWVLLQYSITELHEEGTLT